MNRKIIFFLLLLIPFINCGKKGPLKLKPEINPPAVTNFTATQVGSAIRLKWDFPKKLGDRKTELELAYIKRIDVFYAKKSIANGKFRKKSSLIKKVTFEQISPYEIPINKYALENLNFQQRKKLKRNSYYLDIGFKVKDLNTKYHWFALRYIYKKKKSPLGQITSILTQTPPIPIEDLTAAKEKKLIKLKWSKPKLDLLGMNLTNISGYDIFRRIVASKTDDPSFIEGRDQFKKINNNKIIDEFFEDTDTGIDGKYEYKIYTIVTNKIKSAASTPIKISITDIYPPDIPVNLVCFKAPDHFLLTWKKVQDKDFSHYRIYRKRNKEDEFKMIADNIKTNQYKDGGILKNGLYFYAITTVDDKGNESEMSAVVEEIF